MNIHKLYKIIRQRKKMMPKDSYVSSLFLNEDVIIKKIGEEATEVIIASKNKNKNEIIWEISDLLFHILVLTVEKKITLKEIYAELERRNRK